MCSKILHFQLVSPWKGKRSNSVFFNDDSVDNKHWFQISPTSTASFGLLSRCLSRFTLYSWRLLRGTVDCEDDAYAPPDSFISKSYVPCTECPSANKVLSLSNFFCDVLVYGLAFALLAFPWGMLLSWTILTFWSSPSLNTPKA